MKKKHGKQKALKKQNERRNQKVRQNKMQGLYNPERSGWENSKQQQNIVRKHPKSVS